MNATERLQLIILQAQTLLDEQPPVTPPAPERIPIKTALDLRAAFKKGGVYRLEPGLPYVGNWIAEAPIDLEGPRDAILAPLDLFEPTLMGKASDVRLAGFTVVNGLPDRDTVIIGDFEATTVSFQPRNVVLDGLLVQAGSKGGHRGIALHGSDLAVRNCEVLNFWEAGRDSQAIWCHNGPGPYILEGNLLEASGENILFGGSSVRIPGCVPTGSRVFANRLRKPAAFKTNGSAVKCSFELKNARQTVFADNVIDGWWEAGHAAPIQITPRNQDGDSPWCIVDGTVIRRTVFTNVVGGFAVNVQGTDNEHVSEQMQTLSVISNLFAGSKALIQVLGGITGALLLDHNTAPHITTKVFSFDSKRSFKTPLIFTNNVVRGGTYGVSGDGSTAMGLASLLAFCDVTDWSGNLIEAGSVPWPAGQTTIPKGQLAALLDPVTFKLVNGTAGY